jgi:FKBP-type peptidyl-prolyl cis-trans isomerase
MKGWTEGLQLMSVGSIYKFFIPSELAFGEKGAGDDVGPNETLIFEIELIQITTKK